MAAPRTGEPVGLEYDATLRRVMSLPDFERSSNTLGHAEHHLERTALLLERLGDPHLLVPAVHVAGTKGKGSTAAMVTSALAAQGYKTGLYTSPHLHSVVERIRVGLEPISHGEFSSLVEQAWPAVEWVGESGEYGTVTFFELMTALAFFHFSQIGADFQVVEVGLGGRLDATNVVTPEVSVITSISLDHTATLGDTLALIATEKAGIIKQGVPVVVAPQPEEAMAVFVEIAAERRAPLVQVEKELSWSRRGADMDGQTFDVAGLRGSYSVRIPLLGDHQLENAATAIATAETLVGKGVALSDDSILQGLSRVEWPGRLQVLSRDGPQIVVDGAHNPYSMRRLVQEVRKGFEFDGVVVVFGANGGHSAREMLAELAELAPSVCAVRSRHPRSAPPDEIALAARELGLPVAFESDDVGLATRQALEMCEDGDLLLGAGSLYVVAEVTEEVEGMTPELYPDIKRPTLTSGV